MFAASLSLSYVIDFIFEYKNKMMSLLVAQIFTRIRTYHIQTCHFVTLLSHFLNISYSKTKHVNIVF